ncbi:hypothetical protein ACWEV3_14695 [Saccharopolyspora sp. NPDC003752]
MPGDEEDWGIADSAWRGRWFDRCALRRMATDDPVRAAGAVLTTPGGYPGDRSWAPPGSFREVRSVVEVLDPSPTS